MIVLGVDLSGPTNVAETAIVALCEKGRRLELLETVSAAGDPRLYQVGAEAAAKGGTVIGIDAPLSYNPGGGDRPSDSELRTLVVSRGLRTGSVMAPTARRMVYLTLRGLAVARALCSIEERVRIVEAHPTATLVLRGAKAGDVRELKRSSAARRRLLSWLEAHGLGGAAALDASSDHLVAACAAGLAAWEWARGRPVWMWRATPPAHPFDFAC